MADTTTANRAAPDYESLTVPDYFLKQPLRMRALLELTDSDYMPTVGPSTDHLRRALTHWHAGPDQLFQQVEQRVGEIQAAMVARLTNDRPAANQPETAPPSIGHLTALDLDYGPPPPQLAEPFLAANGATILYGKGGVGKGVTTAWLVLRLIRAGHTVMLVDFEGHPEEWGSRWHGLGISDEEKAQIHYRTPSDPGWTATKGSLLDVADLLAEDCRQLLVTVIVVDSYTTATSTGDTMGGQAAAQEYFGALGRIGLPSLTIAHVRGNAERFPDRPFGSVFVRNLARELWAVESVSENEDQGDPDPDVEAFTTTVKLELRNTKRNRGKRIKPQFLTFTFNADDTIDLDLDRPAGTALHEVAYRILRAEPGMTVDALVKAIREDTDLKPTAGTLRGAMERRTDRFAKDSTIRPHVWSVR